MTEIPKVNSGPPLVSPAPAQRSLHPVYSSLQAVQFPDGRTAMFASQAPFPPGAPMTFEPSLLDRPPGFDVGGMKVHYLVPTTWQPTAGAVGPAKPAPTSYAGRGAGIGAIVGAVLGFLAFLMITVSAYQSAAEKVSFGEPEINAGKAFIVCIVVMALGAGVCSAIGAVIGATKQRPR